MCARGLSSTHFLVEINWTVEKLSKLLNAERLVNDANQANAMRLEVRL